MNKNQLFVITAEAFYAVSVSQRKAYNVSL